ncbi:sugar nucleotide-binding protein [Roseovarius sp.]|jgi:nucleoside-diphosphate-sugar epimerase|uniref:sugar nucleotide-binding protein n=1 Tax=Roseovarius sp. TaxID=1486281 RepID=UPI00261DFCCA|nr:sugar nucleotide-binding protein [Roseovarius sp.]MDM8164837.1 sugar nucleotide-binding protein [Roseovarius sp.]
MQKSVLILGASGRFGRNAADAFWNAGWSIRSFDRRRDDLNEAARGADVIVAAWNPAYPDWAAEIPALHARIQDAARLSGAMVLIPGNVYVYGAQTPAPWREDTPHNATNPLGELRIGMEQSYRDSGVQTVILRAGDFIDTEASGNWLDRMMLPSLPKDKFTYPGQPDIPHAWAYLPDLTRAAAEIAGQKESLPGFTDVTFPGYTLTGLEMTDMLTAVTGRSIALRRMSWLPLHLASPVWPLGRSLLEMRYLWDTPHWLESDRFDELCPRFAATPPQEALAMAAGPWLKPARGRCRIHSMRRSTQTTL